MQQNTLEIGLGGGSLLQYATRGPAQGMGYLLETPNGKLIMIDGGRQDCDDGAYLHDLIAKHGGCVDLWLITHAHNDHFGALLRILRDYNPLDIKIADLRFSFPPADWLANTENGEFLPFVTEFFAQLKQHGICPRPLRAGETIACGGLTIDVLKDESNYRAYQSINDTSTVFRVHYPKRDVLFLGDLGAQAATDLLSCVPPESLQCDIVQMAHHGQNGAGRNFYEVVQPKIALYPTPLWLWENDCGGGRDSGPWKTLQTRTWLEELGVQVSCPHADGDYLLK